MTALALALAGIAAATSAFAADGDLLATHRGLENAEAVDLCRDTTDGSYWVVSRTQGTVFHLDAGFQRLAATDIPNPFGDFSLFTNPVSSRGIAFRPGANTLLIMASRRNLGGGGGSFLLHELRRDGVPVTADPVAIASPNSATADLYGLTWETTAGGALWYLDIENDLLVKCGLDGKAIRTVALPGDEPPETTIYGRGLDFELHPNGLTGYLNVPYGDVFSFGTNRIERLGLSGQRTGMATWAPAPVSSNLFGCVLTNIGGNDAFAIIEVDSANKSVIQVIDRAIQAPLPPSDLACTLTAQGEVKLCWVNHGLVSDGAIYPSGVHVSRNGLLLTSLAGNSTCYVDRTPPEGAITYEVRGSDTGPLSRPASCVIRTGPGGLIRWRPFLGKQSYDICRNPANGDFYVTDTLGGKIYRYHGDLTPYASTAEEPNPIASPSPITQPGGIAFIPEGDEGRGSLMVHQEGGSLMRELSLKGQPLDLATPMNPPSGQSVQSGLAYNPETRLFTYIDRGTGRLIFIDKGGNQSSQVPPVEPPAFITGRLLRGITHAPITDTFYATFRFDDSLLVREIYASGAPSGFSFFVDTLGKGMSLPDQLGGLEINGNSLFLVGKDANAIFEVLLAPLGKSFVRGDANNDATINMSDAIFIARYLFVDGTRPVCRDAADANDDGLADVSDPVYLLFHLFLGGAQPPAPFPEAGPDPTFLDPLDC